MSNTNTIHLAEYEWRIDHCSFYIKKGRNFESPVFSAVTKNRYKWQLQFEFNHYETDDQLEDFVGLFLYVECQECMGARRRKIFGKYKAVVLNNLQQPIIETVNTIDLLETCKFTLDGINGWGLKKVIKKKELLDPELFPNDTTIVHCQVVFSRGSDFPCNLDQPISSQLQLHPYDKYTLSENLRSLLTNQYHSDVVLSVNGKEYHVHKNILAAHSVVFAAMFKHDMKEGESNYVTILDMDEKVVEHMLSYIYTDNIFDNEQQLIEGLYVAADKYDLKGLKSRCEEEMFRNLSVENATQILIMADMHGANELKSKTISFILTNATEVVNTATWNDMIESHPRLLNEVFKALLFQYYAI